MKYWIRLLGLPAVAAFLVCLPVWAQTTGESDGHVSEKLANQMYCSVGDLLQGNIGLLLGLILVFMGIWAMVQGAKIIAVVPMIIIGSLVTALPSLIASSFGGLGVLLVQSHISKPSADDNTTAFSPPRCGAMENVNDLNDALSSSSSAIHYSSPETGSYGPPLPPALNSSGSPDDRDAPLNSSGSPDDRG